MRRFRLPALVLLLAGLACARSGIARSTTDTTAESIVSGGETRQYLLHLPADLGRTERPLILSLHGFSATAAEQQRLDGLSSLADEAGFILAYPQALGDPPAWRVGPLEGGDADVTFLSDLIDELSSRYAVDVHRIYVTGISNGGGMVDRVGCQLADRVAAIAPVSGAYLFWETCQPSRPVPVLAFHGTGDDIVPYAGQGRALPPIRDWAAAWAQRDGCRSGPEPFVQQGAVTGERWTACEGGAEVQLYTVEGGGHWWPGAAILPGVHRPSDDVDANAVMWAFFEAHPLP